MTHAEFAILSLIAEAPRHGYEIEQTIEQRGMRDWTEIGFSSIYYLLKKLEKEGLIEPHLEQPAGKGPARQVYRITPAGRETCLQASLNALATPHRNDTPFQMGLANFPFMSTEQALSALRRHHSALLERRTYVKTRWEVQRPVPFFVDAMFEYSLAMIEAECVWIENFIKQLEERNDTH